MVRHRELVKFAVTGGTCFVLTGVVNYGLKLTVLHDKPVTALTIATVIATIVSYLMNRGWSFRTRSGHGHVRDAALFALISGVGIAINDIPLYLARYAFDLKYPAISHLAQETSDFVNGMIIGTLLAMGFRWWALKRWVFPRHSAAAALGVEDDRAMR